MAQKTNIDNKGILFFLLLFCVVRVDFVGRKRHCLLGCANVIRRNLDKPKFLCAT